MSKEPWYNKIEKAIIIVTMLCMIALTFFTVVTRFVFAYTLSWAEQMERLLMIYMFFAGMSWAGKLDLHYKVTAGTLLFRKFPRFVKGMMVFGDLMMTAFGIYMAVQIGLVTYQMILTGPVLASMPFIPKWVQYLPGVLGMVGMSARILQRLVISYRKERKTEVLPEEGGASA